MLRCKADRRLWLRSLLLLQTWVGLIHTEESDGQCLFHVSEQDSRLDYISLKLTTTGQDCSFIISSPESETDSVECTRTAEDNRLETNQIKSKTQTSNENEELKHEYLTTNELWENNGGSSGGANFTCRVEHLEPGSAYHLCIQSNRDGQTHNFTGYTSPSAVSGLAVSSRSTRGLGLSWQAGPGRTERYRLQLWERPLSKNLSGLIRNDTLESTATQHTIQNLTPGRLYTITMTTESGSLQNSTSTEASTVPAAVSNITLDDRNSTSLLLSWQQPEGDLEALTVTVLTSDTRVWETVLPHHETQVSVNKLTPGSVYKITVMSSSHGLSSQSQITLRTAPEAVSELSMRPSSDGGLTLSWAAPHGSWDGFRLFLFDGSQPLVNTTVTRETVHFSVPGAGLTPGRQYKALLRVESGELYAERACEGFSAPAPVVDLHIRHADETSLSVMWSHPSGLRDNYFLIIHHGNVSVDTREVQASMRECTFNVLTPGRLYTITVMSRSGTQNSSVSVEGQTVPMPLKMMTLSSAGVNSLQLLWEKPPGDVELYKVTLFQQSKIVQNYSVPEGQTSLLLSGLTPGTLYSLQAATVSGGVQSKPTNLEGRTAPASVSDITTSNGGRSDALQVSWRPAAGAVDSYLVRLQDGPRPVHTLAVSRSSTPECSFSSLVAGRLYSVVIVTRSGSLENSTTVQARTQPATVQNPTAVHSGRDDFLKVYWRHAAGDHDYYVVQILYNNRRLYTVTVETWSGDYVNTVSTDGRTLPAAVGNLSVVSTETDGLTVSWSPAPGDVDHYEVTLLFNDTQVFLLLRWAVIGPFQKAQFIEGRTVPSAVRTFT
ncbi:hypothetical protein WMY93_022093 [Mugilogobius chulae]|uniref:Fibronectin type-III domain-containing protein n=1 Tax=Mugilogobius chulae TaxID=88201 RepID=A0AAW0NCR0_9GOBI